VHLAPLIEHLTSHGYCCQILSVPYEFQRGGNQMLKVLA
jgi:hypothetical protein